MYQAFIKPKKLIIKDLIKIYFNLEYLAYINFDILNIEQEVIFYYIINNKIPIKILFR